MSEVLLSAKPKTMSKDLYCYVFGKNITLDFKTSRIFIPNCLDQDTQRSMISHKDFFDKTEESTGLIAYEHNFNYEIDKSKFSSIPINIMDSNVFNSQASIGEDLFIVSKMTISNNSLDIKALGHIYCLSYKMNKVEPGVIDPINITLDFHSVYYLNVLFKKVSKTKVKSLMYYDYGNGFYLTNEDFDLIIDVPKEDLRIKLFLHMLDVVLKHYESIDFNEHEHSYNRVQFSKDKDPSFKHLSKSLGDTLIERQGEFVNKYLDEKRYCTLYLSNKKKEE